MGLIDKQCNNIKTFAKILSKRQYFKIIYNNT